MLAGALVFAVAASAGAASIRVVGTSDEDSRSIRRFIENAIQTFEAQAGIPLVFDDSILVTRTDGRSFVVTVPAVSIEVASPNGLTAVRVDASEAQITARESSLFDFAADGLPGMRVSAGDSELTFRLSFLGARIRGTYDTASGLTPRTSAQVDSVLVEDGDGFVSLRFDNLVTEDSTSSSGNGLVDFESRSSLGPIVMDVLGGQSRIENLEGVITATGVPFDDYIARRYRGMNGLTEDAVDQAMRVMRGVAGSHRYDFKLSGMAFATFGGGRLEIEKIDSLLLSGRESEQHVDAKNVRYSPPTENLGRALRIETAGVSSRITLDPNDLLNVNQRVRFSGLKSDSTLSRFIPTEGSIELGVDAVPIRELMVLAASLEAEGSGAPQDPAASIGPLIAMIAAAGSRAYLETLDLKGREAGAVLESRVEFDLASSRFTTTPNRLAVRGIGPLVAALSANANASAQLLEILGFAGAMGRTEVRGDETVHIYELGNGPNGGFTLNGWPLGGPQ
jgi:hypothetical protein